MTSFPPKTPKRPAARSPLRRILQPIEGDADRFSSEGSLALPVGSRLGPPERPRGYYIDLSVKAADPSWPPPWLETEERQLHVGTVQWALGAWERYVDGQGEAWRQGAIDAAEHLLSIQQREGAQLGAWLHWFPMPHTYALDPPWASGITQGEAASLFVRLHGETGEERYAEAAVRALSPLGRPTSTGGLMAETDGQPFFEEYPTRPASLVLNGAIFALWGVRDVSLALGDSDAAELYRAALDNLIARLPLYDTGYWSRYDMFPHLIPNVASGAYHGLHITQLSIMHQLEGRPELKRAQERFEGYRASRSCRTRAFSTKVAFRLISPRNEKLARALPGGTRRARRRQGDLVVLCYHGVSDGWDPGLAVSVEQLESQVRTLLDRGYRPATFSEAVLGPRSEDTFAVTFDDAYASVGEHAAPVLDRLGVPGTVFVPTALADSDGPMSWPGIDHMVGGPDERELLPLSWDSLRALADSGWEIGSHTRSHARLTELDDERLLAELRDSRVDCEQRMGGDCLSVAYPYGDMDRRVVRAAARAGYASGGALPPPYDDGSPLAFPRIGVFGIDDKRRFRLKLAPAMRRLRSGRLGGLLIRMAGGLSGVSGPFPMS